jgi:hypothetical protein
MEIALIVSTAFITVVFSSLGFYFLKEHLLKKENLKNILKTNRLKKDLEKEVLFYKSLANEYQLELDCYKKGLGIFPGDRQDAAEELWARAAQGEEDAYYIMLELMDVELEANVEKLPQKS